MVIHANSTPAPERTLLREAAAPGRLLPAPLPSPARWPNFSRLSTLGPAARLHDAPAAGGSPGGCRRADRLPRRDRRDPDLEPSLGANEPGATSGTHWCQGTPGLDIELVDEDGDPLDSGTQDCAEAGIADLDGLCEQLAMWDGRIPHAVGATLLERRNLLRGLVTLPLIGGGVTLIGRPAARVRLADVAVAPLHDDPRQRARYAWEAFSAAMRDVTAGADGWHVTGGQRMRGLPHLPAAESWPNMRAVHHVPLGLPCRGGFSEEHADLSL